MMPMRRLPFCFLLLMCLAPLARSAAASVPETVEQREVQWWLSGMDRPAVRLCALLSLQDWVPAGWFQERLEAYVRGFREPHRLAEVLVRLVPPAQADRFSRTKPLPFLVLHGEEARFIAADAYGAFPVQEVAGAGTTLRATHHLFVKRPVRIRLTAAGGAPGAWCADGRVVGMAGEVESSYIELDLPAGAHRLGMAWSYRPRRPMLRVSGEEGAWESMGEAAQVALPAGCPETLSAPDSRDVRSWRFVHRSIEEINHEAMAQCDVAAGRMPDEDSLLRFVPLDPHFRAKLALLRGENPAPWLPRASAEPWMRHENDLILAAHWMETRVTEPARILWEGLSAESFPSVRPRVRSALLRSARGMPASAVRELQSLAGRHPDVPGIWQGLVEALDAARMDTLPAREAWLRLHPSDVGERLVTAEILRARGDVSHAARRLEDGWNELRDIRLLSAWHRLPGQASRALSAASAFSWFAAWAQQENRPASVGATFFASEGMPEWLTDAPPERPEFPAAGNRLDASLPAAEILHFDQVLQVEPDGSSRYSRRMFLLIRNPLNAAIEPFTVTYAPHSQNLRILATQVHHADGTVSSRAASVTSGELVDGPARMYFDLRQVRIAFPPAASGDIVEFWYVLEDLPATHGNLGAAAFGHILPMQERWRISSQRVRILAPAKTEMKYLISLPAEVRTSSGTAGGRSWLEFRTRAVDAWREEPFAPGWGETLLFLQLGTSSSWQEIGASYWRFVEPLYRLRPSWRELAQKIAANARNDVERIQAVHAWVQKNFRYVSLMFGEHGYLPYSLDEILERRFGDCKDMTLLLVVLLRSLGIEALPAIVRTRDLGDLPADVPSLAPFNHSVVHLPAHKGWIDGTVKGLLFPAVPAWIQGRQALVVSPGGGELVRIPSDAAGDNRDSYDFSISLKDASEAEISGRIEVHGQAESVWRQLLEGDARKSALRLLSRVWPGAVLASWDAGDLASLRSPLVIRFSLRVPEIVQKRARGIVLALDFGAGADLSRLIANPVRRHDFLLNHPFVREWNATIRLPRNWCAAGQPRSLEVDAPPVSFRQSFVCDRQVCRLERSLKIAVSRVAAAQYPAFIDALNRALLAMHEELQLAPCVR